MKVIDLSIVPSQEQILDNIEQDARFNQILVIEEYSEDGKTLVVNNKSSISSKLEHIYEPCINHTCSRCHCGRCAESTDSIYNFSLELPFPGLTITGRDGMLLDIETLRSLSKGD